MQKPFAVSNHATLTHPFITRITRHRSTMADAGAGAAAPDVDGLAKDMKKGLVLPPKDDRPQTEVRKGAPHTCDLSVVPSSIPHVYPPNVAACPDGLKHSV
jgi:hypothetical protein